MKDLLVFISVGIAYALPPEIVNQVYVKKSWAGFFGALVWYVLLLSLGFAARKIYRRFFRLPQVGEILWFTVWGSVGLCIEWFLLGNAGAAWYGQSAMFIFWASFFSMPVVAVERRLQASFVEKALVYYLSWYCLILISGLFNGDFALLVWILGSNFSIYFWLVYFRKIMTGQSDSDYKY